MYNYRKVGGGGNQIASQQRPIIGLSIHSQIITPTLSNQTHLQIFFCNFLIFIYFSF